MEPATITMQNVSNWHERTLTGGFERVELHILDILFSPAQGSINTGTGVVCLPTFILKIIKVIDCAVCPKQ